MYLKRIVIFEFYYLKVGEFSADFEDKIFAYECDLMDHIVARLCVPKSYHSIHQNFFTWYNKKATKLRLDFYLKKFKEKKAPTHL